jgi:predicted RNA methylase
MKIWSDVEYVYRCLADRERTLAFQESIRAVVKPGDIVLDLGTGSGIMALFAAKAGARKVFAIDIGDFLSRASHENFMENGYGETIVSLHMDAQEVTLTHIPKPDVLICEMVTTGLIGEMQGPVINSLKRSGVIDKQTLLVPAGISTSVALVYTDRNVFGVQLRFPIFVDYFTRSFRKRYEILSEDGVAHLVNFSSDFSEEVKIRETIHISRSGSANGLLLTSLTNFVGGAQLGSCVSYCQPVILPLKEVKVLKGSVVAVAIQYQMGEVFDSLAYDVRAME